MHESGTEDLGGEMSGPDPLARFDSPAEYPHGMTVDRESLCLCRSRSARRVLVRSLIERIWIGLDDLLVDLAEAVSADPSWVEDVGDLILHAEVFSDWPKELDLCALMSFARRATPEDLVDPLTHHFFEVGLASVERRPEAMFSPDARLFTSRVQELNALSFH